MNSLSRGRTQEVCGGIEKGAEALTTFLCDFGCSVTNCYGMLLPHLSCLDGPVSQNHLQLMVLDILLLQEKHCWHIVWLLILPNGTPRLL